MFAGGISENVHCNYNFMFLNLICEKIRNVTLQLVVYVLVNPCHYTLTKLKGNQSIHSGQNSRST